MKDKNQKKNVIVPQRLDRESKFKFRCHPDIACFTKCCSDINIILTPYDILRMKNRLGMTSDEFLLNYTRYEHLDKIGLPVVVMNMKEGDEKSCPFVTPEGCTIYSDRPVTCRYYPVGFAANKHELAKDQDEFYFFVKEDHCLGFQEDTEWTIQGWREDQEPDLYDELNKEWIEIIALKKAMGEREVPEESLKLFFMVSYNLDQFWKFVFESSFLEKYSVDKETAEKMKDDEAELMRFGLMWLKRTLFGG